MRACIAYVYTSTCVRTSFCFSDFDNKERALNQGQRLQHTAKNGGDISSLWARSYS